MIMDSWLLFQDCEFFRMTHVSSNSSEIILPPEKKDKKRSEKILNNFFFSFKKTFPKIFSKFSSFFFETKRIIWIVSELKQTKRGFHAIIMTNIFKEFFF